MLASASELAEQSQLLNDQVGKFLANVRTA
jgi:hypothetical protein